jgi:AraC family transcriptional regulator, regulatory protein of adaptative response / methylated-DNA-[protein]-cysteine methyltransferase
MQFAIIEWQFGVLLALQSELGLRAILLGTHADDLVNILHRQCPSAQQASTNSRIHRVLKTLADYAKNPAQVYQGPIDLQGTPFQKRVWNQLRIIPLGSQMSYSEVANAIGHPNAYRAVANACGANPLPLVIPCHRVISQRGLGGYRFGLPLKRKLLEHEKVYAA